MLRITQPDVEALAPRLLSDLQALVERESPSDEAAAVTALARFIADKLASRGLRDVDLHRLEPRGDALLASIGPVSKPGAPLGTLLLGHLDTVWPMGTLEKNPFRIEEDARKRARGPGVFDMKAGIAVAMSALPLLVEGGSPPRVSLLLVPDEEIGSGASRDLLLQVAKQHRCVLVLEPSADGGAAKTARKGTGLFELTFHGRAAHAGLEPEKGASALAEMARFVLFLEDLGDPTKGTTVTPTLAAAGTKTNVVPERATLSVDARVWSKGEAERVQAAVRDYKVGNPLVTLSADSVRFDRPPMEPTEVSLALFASAQRIAAALGFELGEARVGGASDGNLTADAGVPTLDGLGPEGAGAHAWSEFVDVADLPKRVALIANLVLEAAKEEAAA